MMCLNHHVEYSKYIRHKYLIRFRISMVCKAAARTVYEKTNIILVLLLTDRLI